MKKIYRSFINGAPFLIGTGLITSVMHRPLNGWQIAFCVLALLNSIKYLIDYEYKE